MALKVTLGLNIGAVLFFFPTKPKCILEAKYFWLSFHNKNTQKFIVATD